MMISPFQNGDNSAVISIWREASSLAHPFLTGEQLDTAEAMIRDHFQDITETYIAELNGQPVGFVALMGNEIGELFLRPSYHGLGIGKALVDKAVEVRGELHLEVFKANPVGRRFYQKYGFVEGAEKMDPFFGHRVLELTYSP